MVTFDQEKIQIAVPEGALDTETQFTYLSYSSLAYSTGGMGYAGISFQLTAQQTASGDPVTTFDPAAPGDCPLRSCVFRRSPGRKPQALFLGC
jgi:hypothetical protein